jgi:hypothetical protein
MSVSERNPFTLLPCEITHHILSFLSPKELSLTILVCRLLQQTASSDSLWRDLIKRDFVEGEMTSAERSVQGVALMQIYRQCHFTKKQNTTLNSWMYSFPRAESFERPLVDRSPVQEYCESIKLLSDSYYLFIDQNYEKIGRVFGLNPLNSTSNFSFQSIEAEHKTAVLYLLQQAILTTGELKIEYFKEYSPPQGLPPLQAELLQEAILHAKDPIKLSFCQIGLKNKDLPLICKWIAKGHVTSLCLDENLIDDKGLRLLLKASKSKNSKLSSLSVYSTQISEKGKSLLKSLS